MRVPLFGYENQSHARSGRVACWAVRILRCPVVQVVTTNEEATTCFRKGGLLYPNSRPGSGNSNPCAKDRPVVQVVVTIRKVCGQFIKGYNSTFLEFFQRAIIF